MRQRLLNIILILGVATTLSAKEHLLELSISPLGGSMVPPGTVGGEHDPKERGPLLYFVDESLQVKLATALYGTAESPVDFPVAGWQETLELEIRSHGENGGKVAVNPKVLETGFIYDTLIKAGNKKRPTSRLLPGEAIYCNADLGTLPVGRYTIRASMKLSDQAIIHARPFDILVKTGTENDEIRRMYLRFKSHGNTTKEQRLEIARELIKLEPDNPGHWETLACAALDDERLEDARDYYARMREISARNLAKNATTREAQESADARLKVLSTIDRVYEFAKANQAKFRIKADWDLIDHSLRFIWIDKSTGRAVAFVNPDKPEEMLPLPERKIIVINE